MRDAARPAVAARSGRDITHHASGSHHERSESALRSSFRAVLARAALAAGAALEQVTEAAHVDDRVALGRGGGELGAEPPDVDLEDVLGFLVAHIVAVDLAEELGVGDDAALAREHRQDAE